jgi:threonyl-tRNA synthetase
MWLSPVQVVVATISEAADGYANEAAAVLRKAGLRVEVDTRGEKINYKIREHSLQKIPVIAVVGGKEAEERKLALRRFGSQANEVVLLDDAAKFLVEEALPPDLKRAKAGV